MAQLGVVYNILVATSLETTARLTREDQRIACMMVSIRLKYKKASITTKEAVTRD